MLPIEETIKTILSPSKGMLVADEYAELLVADRSERSRAVSFVETIAGTPGLTDHVSSILLTGSTFEAAATCLPAAPLVGVRLSTKNVSESEFMELVRAHASFVEWRAHVSFRDVPKGGVHIDGRLLAEGAESAQEQGLLPVLTIAMPDLGTSSVGITQAVTTNALLSLVKEMEKANVDPSQLLLRVNMVVAGVAHPAPTEPSLVADLTMTMLERCVPHEIGGVLLLSGGQSLDRACTNLEAVSALAAERAVPWPLSYGFSRALVTAAAEVFSDEADDQTEARRLLLDSARHASEALAPSRVANGTSP
jgi:fructose-bisphosphate aldolase class I